MRTYILLFIIVTKMIMGKAFAHEINIEQFEQESKDILVVPARSVPVITVWVHGTKLMVSKFIRYFGYCPEGLSLATEIPERYYHRTIAQTLIQEAPHLFDLEHFYFFGWSGKLSFTERKLQGELLYNALKNLKLQYKQKYGVTPYIRIITHSHGGNVVLNMVPFYALEKELHEESFIDELILLACPVQMQTKHYIHSPCFKQVISFFSVIDSLQVLDPQGIYVKEKKEGINVPFFSRREFENYENLVQCGVYKGWRGIGHVEFIVGDFLKRFGTILSAIEYKKKETRESFYKIIL